MWACSCIVANLAIVLGMQQNQLAREPKPDGHNTGYWFVFSHSELSSILLELDFAQAFSK